MGQTVTLELWRMPEAKYKVECYFWCTLDGKVPGRNCIKIGLPGKLILSKRKGLQEVLFSKE